MKNMLPAACDTSKKILNQLIRHQCKDRTLKVVSRYHMML